jgi:sugar/nucleoside kinase (ribokinase family)
MPYAYDLVVLGEINVDLILTGDAEPVWGQTEKLVDDAQLVPGGSSMIFACGAARLGLRTAYVGVSGDDAFGTFMREHLNGAGVDTSHVVVDPNIRTGMTVLLSRPDGDRALLTYLGSIAALRAEQVDRRLLRSARFLHVGCYFLQRALQPGLAELFAYARAAGTTTSLDTNWDPSEQWDSGLAAVLAHTDVFLPNAAEAQHITRTTNTDAALGLLTPHVPTVGIKLGAAGGVAMRGAERVMVRPPQMTPLDTTGAGDSFDAGFIAGLANELSLRDTLAMATACGSLSTRGIGGTAAQASWDEAWECASQLRDAGQSTME